MGHIFKTGQFKGSSIEQAFLTRYAELKNFIKWARKQDNLTGIVKQFNRLEKIISDKKLITHSCSSTGCGRPAEFLSMLGNSPQPYFWCDKHEPWESRAIKRKISFKFASNLSTKTEQRFFCKVLHKALGVKRVTKKNADSFFYN